MIWDLLVFWMSHVGQGSWSGFKRAVAALAPPDVEPSDAARMLRTRFSDLGVAEFFVDETQRWRAFSPMLVASAHARDQAFLCGARTPTLLAALKKNCERFRCQCFSLVVDGFTATRVHGAKAPEVAAASGVGFEPDISRRLTVGLTSLATILAEAQLLAFPTNWAVRSYDLQELRWKDGARQGAALEFASRYGRRMFGLDRGGGRLLSLPRREAVYSAAAQEGRQLAAYESSRRELSTPITAPLPEAYARTACVSCGRASVLEKSRIVYREVPPQLAAVILVGLQHPPPGVVMCGPRSRATERRR